MASLGILWPGGDETRSPPKNKTRLLNIWISQQDVLSITCKVTGLVLGAKYVYDAPNCSYLFTLMASEVLVGPWGDETRGPTKHDRSIKIKTD